MKEQMTTGNSPRKTFLGLIIAASFICFFQKTKSASLKGKQVVLLGKAQQYVIWSTRGIPELCRFTVCLDLNKTKDVSGKWAAFSYDTNSYLQGIRSAELALFAEGSILNMSLMGSVFSVGEDFLLYRMHQVCCVWDSMKGMMEIFHNGDKMEKITLPHLRNRCLRPNGTLVLGQLHKNHNGHIILHPGFPFVGILHYFQMWDFVRQQQEMRHCQPPGSVVSWQRGPWSLNEVRVASAHHQRCGEEETTSKSPLHTSREPHPSSSVSAGLTWDTTGAPPSSGITTNTATQSSEATHSLSTTEHGGTTPEPSLAVSTQPTSTGFTPVAAVTFYNVQINFTVTSKWPNTFDYYDVKNISTNWFEKILSNSEFVVSRHKIKSNEQPRVNILRRELRSKAESGSFMLQRNDNWASRSYSSKSIVSTTSNQTKEEIVEKLRAILCGVHTEEALSMTVHTDDVQIAYFDPGNCQQETIQSNYKGMYAWPWAVPTTVAHLPCNRNREQFASRECSIKMNKGIAYWKRQNLTSCQLLQSLPNNIMDLQNVVITVENAEDVVDRILVLLNTSTLTKGEVDVLVQKLTEIANCEEVSMTLAKKVLQVINIFMTMGPKADSLQEQVNSILKIMQRVGFKVDFSERKESIIFPQVAMTLMRPDPVVFHGVAFGVVSYDSEKDPEIDIRQVPFQQALASIFLPEIMKNYLKAQSFEPEDHTEIQFSFFGTTSLFTDSSYKDATLNTYVIGASIENVSVQNLKEPVIIILQHIEKNKDGTALCVFWDFAKNEGCGGWNTLGCQTKSTDENFTMCVCNHLTHFGVLLDISRLPSNEIHDRILTWLSYLGCGMSSIFLGLSLVVHLSIDKLRRDYPSKIFINLCFALLLLNLVFLLNEWLASFHTRGLCVAVAVILHYFLLAAFTWMGLEAVHMYYALIKVFNTYFPSYMLKFSIAGWGIPAVIVVTVLLINTEFYGTGIVVKNNSSYTDFCWIQNNVVFYTSVLAYFCVIFLLNSGMFIAVLLQIRAMKGKTPRHAHNWGNNFLHDLKRVGSLMFLLGLTWGFAFFAWGPVKTFFMYLFAICNTLQGLFIFVFHCLMKENVRKQCQIHFCCGRFRLNLSDWTSSATTLGYHHPPRDLERKPSSQSLKSQKSCATVSTSNGSGSLPGNGPYPSIADDHVLFTLNFVPLTREKIRFPRARRASPVAVELQ